MIIHFLTPASLKTQRTLSFGCFVPSCLKRVARRPSLQISAILCLTALTAIAEPPAGKEWIPFEPMTDEFNGTKLDSDKWYDHNPTWWGRAPTMFHPDCVTVSNGMLNIWALNSAESAKRKLPGGFTHISGFVRSKARARFGYFEMRAKLMDSSQVSCFWLTHVGREEWSEIDICEVAAGVEDHQDVFTPNLHYFHGPHYQGTLEKHLTDQSWHKMDFRFADDFHLFAAEWSPTFIRWYIDGKLIRETHNSRYFQPLEMNINVEANQWFGALPDDAKLPAVYQIDWIRSWRLKEY